jgi:amino acid adenylation domain-containing protein
MAADQHETGNPSGPMLERNLPRAVERHARETPDAPALRASGRPVSYAELNERANRLARRLESIGAAPGGLVGLCLPRGPDLIVALVAILKSGAAYLPLDPDYPVKRLRRIAGQAMPEALVTERYLRERLGLEVPAVCLEHDQAALAGESAADSGRPIADTQLCYVMFTSGSTGEPKGVMVNHGNVARLFTDIGPRLALGPADVWSQIHSCAFGFSVFEIWGALMHGACLAVAPAAVRADALALREWLRKTGVTILSQTPSAFRETSLAPAFAGAWPTLAVRALILSGEAVLTEDLRRWSEQPAPHGARLVNTYAITETGGNVMFREYAAGDTDARNIGRPLTEVEVHVLDAAHRPVAVGEPGELFVGGPGVAAGYINDAALTASRFVTLSGAPGRVYRTGDLVRVMPDRSIEFLGRVDDQVKWRGHRLELGEIESLLRTHPGVSAAAAAIHADGAGNEKLVAYVVPGAGASPLREPEIWPSLGGFGVYDDFLYDLMSADALRNEAFRAAFTRHARDRVVLDLGTGPSALLARLAAAAGARRVYAVEIVPDVADRARAAVAAAGLADRITVITGDAMALELPERAEVCAQGIIGNIGSADGITPIWNRVRAGLAPGYVAVPARCTTLMAAVELPELLRESPVFAPLAQRYVQRIFAAEGRAFDLRLCIRNLDPACLISDRQVFEDLDFHATLPDTWRGSATLTLNRAGRFDGFVLWTVVTTTEGVALDYLEHQYAWLPVFMPLPQDGPELSAGARIRAEWEWATGATGIFPDYTIRCEYSLRGRVQRAVYTTRHRETAHGSTAIHRRLLALRDVPPDSVAPGDLRAWLARHLPEPLLPSAWMYLDALPLNANGKLDRRALPAPGTRTWGGRGGAPQTALESDLAAIWSDVLGVSAVGMQDNFFDLGGDSIAAVRVTTRIQQLLDDAVMLAAVFEAPTIAALARYLGERHLEAVEVRYGRRPAGAGRRGARPGSRRKHGEL